MLRRLEMVVGQRHGHNYSFHRPAHVEGHAENAPLGGERVLTWHISSMSATEQWLTNGGAIVPQFAWADRSCLELLVPAN